MSTDQERKEVSQIRHSLSEPARTENVKVHWVPRIAWADRPEFCPCVDEETHPVCPACPATVAGNDPVHGVCQARRSGPPPRPLVELILVDRDAEQSR